MMLYCRMYFFFLLNDRFSLSLFSSMFRWARTDITIGNVLFKTLYTIADFYNKIYVCNGCIYLWLLLDRRITFSSGATLQTLYLFKKIKNDSYRSMNTTG